MGLLVKPPVFEQVEPQAAPAPEKLRLSQSLIKAIGNGEMCPRFYYEYHLTRQVAIPPTEAQKLGQYFEWLAFKNPPKDGLIVLPDNGARGGKLADTVRVEKQAQRASSIIQQYGLSIIIPDGFDSPAITFFAPLPAYPHIMFEGTLDMMAEYREPNTPLVIIDVKVTASLQAKFMGNRPGWGDYMNMDHSQAVAYLWLVKQKFPDKLFEFMYFVFSYGPKADYKPIRIRFDKQREREFLTLANSAAATLEAWQEDGWPTKGHPDVCLRCRHRATCASAQLFPAIEDFDL